MSVFTFVHIESVLHALAIMHAPNNIVTCAGAHRTTSDRASVLGEFGGISCNTPGHEWDPHHSFTYKTIVKPLLLHL